MAKTNIFLRITDRNGGFVLGESYDLEYLAAIDLTSWGWSVNDPAVENTGNASNPDNPAAASNGRSRNRNEVDSGGGESKKPKPSSLTITKFTDRSTTRLLGAMDRGEVFPLAVLSIKERFEDSPLPFEMQIVLTDVFVMDFKWNISAESAGMTMKEDWELNYGKIAFAYHWRGGIAGWLESDFEKPADSNPEPSRRVPTTKAEIEDKKDADFDDRFAERFDQRFDERIKKLGLNKK
jgi:type VI protein secretion system component Hcp